MTIRESALRPEGLLPLVAAQRRGPTLGRCAVWLYFPPTTFPLGPWNS